MCYFACSDNLYIVRHNTYFFAGSDTLYIVRHNMYFFACSDNLYIVITQYVLLCLF